MIGISGISAIFAQQKPKRMIQSMTGYGKAEAILSSGKLTLEIRTLNGKSAEIDLKTI